MKKNQFYHLVAFVFCMTNFIEIAMAQSLNPCEKSNSINYFGVEINKILCGYAVESYCYGIVDGEKVRFEYSDVTYKMSLLGAGVDAGFKVLYVINPITERASKIEVKIINNQSIVNTTTTVVNDTIYFKSSNLGADKVIPAGKEVMISSQVRYPYLFEDFIKKGISEKKYKVFDPMKGEITEKVYTRKPEEYITLKDSLFHTLVLEETELSTGIKVTLWLNKSDGYNVKSITAGRQAVYLSDKSVSSRIKQANMDDLFFTKTNQTIPDMMNLTYIKVKAQINSYGDNITTESLNYPGQKFTGTIDKSLIDGIFEIEPARYNGENAPSFPPDFIGNTELQKYLQPELTIESDNPLIISEAKRITSGSKNSWEAAVRLSKWVSENIAGAIPGGISAINTLKTQEAECGGHSRLLAAFCRSLGIPARLSVGCMYTTNYSGSFGQHAWTEVYMGSAGWIPVDATISEFNYIDAGHIRLGENATFRPVKMEILEYKLNHKSIEVPVNDPYNEILGNFMNVEQYRMFSIIKKDDGIAIDIKGRVVLDLNPPDENGILYPKLTREIGLLPKVNPVGKTDIITIHQSYRLNKMSSPDSGTIDIPVEFRKFAGNYQFTQLKLSVDVMFDKNVMTTQEPFGRSKEKISYTKTGDIWVDKMGNYEIGFTTNIENEITALILTSKVDYLRGEPVTNVLEKVLKEFGTEVMIEKYDELKKSKNSGYLFSEQMLHQLGQTLIKENKIDDAIAVFRKNASEYPKSFLAIDALAETYLKKGENKLALKYFKLSVKLDPDYEYGKKMIDELKK